jgi:hypothetical protein
MRRRGRPIALSFVFAVAAIAAARAQGRGGPSGRRRAVMRSGRRGSRPTRESRERACRNRDSSCSGNPGSRISLGSSNR